MEAKRGRSDILERIMRELISLVFIVLAAIVLFPLVYFFGGDLYRGIKHEVAVKFRKIEIIEPQPAVSYWAAPLIDTIHHPGLKAQTAYGRELIVHTSKYLGPKGLVMQITNGMNCQNCHLDAGTKTFGNNYSAVSSTYPKFRARSGTMESIYRRVNDCMERSLNGSPLDSLSREMQAMIAYIRFVGSNVDTGEKPEGSGLKELAFLHRESDPVRGELVYKAKCITCHMANGEGQRLPDGTGYLYPPLWGDHSYNDGAGLYRVSVFARYVKCNMPQGASHLNPMLTDEEAWDVAGFVNSQPRPHMKVPNDWPDIAKKPVDYPFGPYPDSFTETEHKYGPFTPILEYQKTITSTTQK
jgi:thiosulfate dehydrogenase